MGAVVGVLLLVSLVLPPFLKRIQNSENVASLGQSVLRPRSWFAPLRSLFYIFCVLRIAYCVLRFLNSDFCLLVLYVSSVSPGGAAVIRMTAERGWRV